LALACILSLPGLAFQERPSTETVLAGYQRRLAGEVLTYHSPDPGVTQGLLVRSLDERRSIAWETAPLPAEFEGEFVSFIWLFALQVNPDSHRFELRVGGESWFELRNPLTAAVRDWTLAGPEGAQLRLRATMIDRFGDLMGYAFLRVPREKLIPGAPLRLEVVGESAGSRAWFIVFQTPVQEQARLVLHSSLVRSEEGDYRPVLLELTHLGEATEARVTSSFGAPLTCPVEFGGNQIELRHPSVAAPTDLEVQVDVASGARHSLTARLEPVRPWTIDLVQHVHTDVGYTRPQTEILPEHLRFIDTALDYCDQTDDYPEEARFRWTCEASWAVREYLASRPERQIERLRRRVEEGRIEITAMFLNMSEVMDEASFTAFLEPVRDFRVHGLRVTTGMQNDINGAAWCLADHFAELGIDYLTMGQHGHRALAPFDVATPFWWESPAGNRLLAFRADHYMTGNSWGSHTGRVEVVAPELMRYLARIERAGYPFDRVAIQHSGYHTDNSPPSTASSELVRSWNERYVWPRLRCSIARDFMDYVAANHADELEVRRQAWPDWWTDGFGSAARESAAARGVQGLLVAAEGLLALEELLGIDAPAVLLADVDEIRDDLLFYGEHTFGAAESIREPLCENTVVQWREKAAYAWDAVKRAALLMEGALGRLPAILNRAPEPKLVVVNTLDFPRSGLLELYVDHELLPADRPFRILDEGGRELSVQLIRSREEGSYWAIWVEEVPAFGWRSFRVEVAAEGEPLPSAPRRQALELSNEHYQLRLDDETGAIASLVDRHSGRQYVDPSSPWGFGQLIHETLGNREQLEGFHLDDYGRSTPTEVEIEGALDGPVWSSLFVRGELPGCEGPGGARWEVRLFHPSDRIELHYNLQKRRVLQPEGIYVAFPFGPSDGRILYETLGGIAAPAEDILPGAASDWQTMQGFAAVQWKGAQAVLSSDEIPLVQFGELNLGKFQRETRVPRPHVFSWVMNNYWTTNFRASQEGEFRWSYALTTSDRPSRGAATRFGAAQRVPLLGRVVPGGGAGPVWERRSLSPVDSPDLILVAARPLEEGLGATFHLREVEGRGGELGVNAAALGSNFDVRACDVLGEAREAGEGQLRIAPYGVAHFQIVRR